MFSSSFVGRRAVAHLPMLACAGFPWLLWQCMRYVVTLSVYALLSMRCMNDEGASLSAFSICRFCFARRAVAATDKQPVHVCSTPTFLSQPRLKICTMTTGGKEKKTADSVNISQFLSSRRVHSAVATTSSRFLFCVFASVVFRMSRFSHSFAAFLHPNESPARIPS